MENLGLGSGVAEPGYGCVDAAFLVDRIQSQEQLTGATGGRYQRVISGVLDGVAADELAAAEGLSLEKVRRLREELRCNLGQYDRDAGLLEEYPLLRRAAERCWRRREDRLESGRRGAVQRQRRTASRHAELEQRSKDQLEDLRTNTLRYVFEGRVTPVGRLGEPVVWVRPGLPPRAGRVAEIRRTRLMVLLTEDGRQVSVPRGRLRATAGVDASALRLDNLLLDSGMSAEELEHYRRLAPGA